MKKLTPEQIDLMKKIQNGETFSVSPGTLVPLKDEGYIDYSPGDSFSWFVTERGKLALLERN